jgi:hypothetical protein
MKREQKMGFFGLILTSLFLVSPFFQNCAKVSFQAASPPEELFSKTSVRKVTVDTSSRQQKAKMKVLFVVDDSYTMSQSQAQLANAMDSLLNPLQGHDVEFKIVSTSGVPSNEVDYSISTKYSTEEKIEIPADQIDSITTYISEKTINVSSLNRHPLLKLYRDSTSSQFTDLKAKIKSAIQNVGVNGSDTEEGLCAAARQIFDDATTSFFKVGDKAAVVILSDENDSSNFENCVTRYVQRVSTKPLVYYHYGQQRANLTLEYQINRDGVTSWQPLVWGVGLSGARAITSGDTCSVIDQTEAASRILAQGYTIRNVTDCIYEIVESSYYGADLGDNGSVSDKNLCTSAFVFNGTAYANFYAMVNARGSSAAPESCIKKLLPSHTVSDPIEYDSVFKTDAVASETKNFTLALLNKSNELFGSGGYIFASLIRLEAESCALSSGQSYGIKYQELSQILGPQKSVVQSLCNTDFSNALSKVSQFIVAELSNSFVLPLQDGESILSAAIIRGRERIELNPTDYETAGAAVTLTNFNLLQDDVLEFELGAK